MGSQLEAAWLPKAGHLFSLYNLPMSDTNAVRLTATVKAAG